LDLNHLLHREGVERLRAMAADCAASRDAHLGLADLYRDRIDFRRRAANDDEWPASPVTPHTS
jgi:hypothetical protein